MQKQSFIGDCILEYIRLQLIFLKLIHFKEERQLRSLHMAKSKNLLQFRKVLQHNKISALSVDIPYLIKCVGT